MCGAFFFPHDSYGAGDHVHWLRFNYLLPAHPAKRYYPLMDILEAVHESAILVANPKSQKVLRYEAYLAKIDSVVEFNLLARNRNF